MLFVDLVGRHSSVKTTYKTFAVHPALDSFLRHWTTSLVKYISVLDETGNRPSNKLENYKKATMAKSNLYKAFH